MEKTWNELVSERIAEQMREIGAENAQLRELNERQGLLLLDNGLEIARLKAQVKELREALETISTGEGRFSRDPLTHASNTIDDMKTLAVEALKNTEKEP